MSAIAGLVLLLASSHASADPGSTAVDLPNLIPRPPGVMLGKADPDTGESAIRLQTPMANAGNAHLDLLGMPEGTDGNSSVASQCIAWHADRACAERVEVGTFIWHPQHGHYHFKGFALYELRRLRDGRPDMSRAGLVVEGNKASFCLQDTDRDSEDATSRDWIFGWPLYKSCNAGSGHQGISVGWADTYVFQREDQQIVVDGVPPGTYVVVIRVDPRNLLFETNDDDNITAVKVRLSADRLIELCVFDAASKQCEPR